jgi:uncharacterized protein
MVVLAVVAMLLGVDPRVLLEGSGTGGGAPQQRGGPPPAGDPKAEFVSVVLADTEDVWHALFQKAGSRYREAGLVLFSDAVESGCGVAGSAVGPFYCPPDGKVYIDLSFFEDLRQRFGAAGDFAQAYVIAHEVGHHVQSLLGISDEVRSTQRGLGKAEANQLSVRLELQADCFAGLWAHHAERTKQILEAGDVEEALGAASAIGDDRLQRQARGQVVPESFTHGTSAQRVRWFRRGLEEGSFEQCDTFQARSL